MQKILLPKVTIEKIILLFNIGTNITNICSQLDLSRRVVERSILEAGYTLKTKSELIQAFNPHLTDAIYLTSLYEVNNLSIKEIAAQLGTNEQVIKTAFKKLNIPFRNAKQAKLASVRKNAPQLGDIAYLKQVYLVEKKSPKQIAKLLNVSSKAVESALKEVGIKTRKHKDSLRKNTVEQNMNAKIARNLRTRLWIALNRQPKLASAVRDLGCSVEELRKKMETSFHPNPKTGEVMSWDNYGENGWEIDHITPLSSYDLSLEKNQKDACNYRNLQPMWIADNRVKSNKIIGTQPNKVPLFIITGPSGCGKSWVCDQLKNINYISFDAIPKEQHYHHMVELSKNGRPIVYDPLRKAKTFYNRYKDYFETYLIVITETTEVVLKRLRSRGSGLKEEDVSPYVNKMAKLAKTASFSGTSQEVLNYLNAQLTSYNSISV